ncbi:MAG: PsbP-related protein [Nitrososphaerota archaeon]
MYCKTFMICTVLCVYIAIQITVFFSDSSAQISPDKSLSDKTNNELEQNASNITTSSTLKYVNRMYGISISYPSSWTFSTAGLPQYSQVVAFYSPLRNLSDSIPARLSLSIMRYQQNISLDGFTNLTLSSLNGSQQFKNTSSGPVLVSGKPGYQVTLLVTPSMQNPIPFGLMQTWTAIGNKVYFLSYSTETSKFTTYLPTIDNMVKSLQIMK